MTTMRSRYIGPRQCCDTERKRGITVSCLLVIVLLCTLCSATAFLSPVSFGAHYSRSRSLAADASPQDATDTRAPRFIDGPPLETIPDYENIHGPLGQFMDVVFLKVFRARMAEKVGFDSDMPQVNYLLRVYKISLHLYHCRNLNHFVRSCLSKG